MIDFDKGSGKYKNGARGTVHVTGKHPKACFFCRNQRPTEHELGRGVVS
jgi:hypothetical protein